METDLRYPLPLWKCRLLIAESTVILTFHFDWSWFTCGTGGALSSACFSKVIGGVPLNVHLIIILWSIILNALHVHYGSRRVTRQMKDFHMYLPSDARTTCCHEASALLCVEYRFGLEWQTGMLTLQALLLISSLRDNKHDHHHSTLHLLYAISSWSTGGALVSDLSNKVL